jgi:hypothetical protein
MNSFRPLLSALVVLLLGAGYLTSQYFWFQGDPGRWAQTIDRPVIAWLALAVLVGSCVLWGMPRKGNGT